LAPQQMPVEQRPAQTLPQPPQLFALVDGSTHAPLQLSWLVGQHFPLMHAPPAQSASAQHRELAMHAPLHGLNPGSHWEPQAPFAQVGMALAPAGQGTQLVPHEFTLVFERQRPPQSCVPAAQLPMHEAPSSMQALAQSFWPAGQLAPHLVPSQEAAPPCGGEQAEQDDPHEAVAVSLAQPPLQAW
jgi:hypothetical protein